MKHKQLIYFSCRLDSLKAAYTRLKIVYDNNIELNAKAYNPCQIIAKNPAVFYCIFVSVMSLQAHVVAIQCNITVK